MSRFQWDQLASRPVKGADYRGPEGTSHADRLADLRVGFLRPVSGQLWESE